MSSANGELFTYYRYREDRPVFGPGGLDATIMVAVPEGAPAWPYGLPPKAFLDLPIGTGFVVGDRLALSASHNSTVANWLLKTGEDIYFARGLADYVDLAAAIRPSGESFGVAGLKVPTGRAALDLLDNIVGREVFVCGWGLGQVRGRAASPQLRGGRTTVVAHHNGHLEMVGSAWACGGDSGGAIVLPEQVDGSWVAIGVTVAGDQYCNDAGPSGTTTAISLLDANMTDRIVTDIGRILAESSIGRNFGGTIEFGSDPRRPEAIG